MSAQQRKIIAYLQTVEQATLSQISEMCNIHYYEHNREYWSREMKALVKQNRVVRVKKGTYAINRTQPEDKYQKSNNKKTKKS